jgi:hypothetical protein
MNTAAIVYVGVGLVAWFVLFLVGEFHAYRRYGKRTPTCTYAWVRAIYHTFNLNRIRW